MEKNARFGGVRDTRINECLARVTTHEGSVQSSRGKHNHPPDLAANKVETAIIAT